MAKKSAKKSTRKNTRKASKITEPILVTPAPIPNLPSSAPAKLNPRFLSLGLIVIALALLVYKFGPYFVPTLVGNKPVTRFALWTRMEKSYGTQTLDDLVNETILDKAIRDAGIKVDQAKVDEQVKKLETQFESLGGLDAALKERGLTRNELIKQVKTQLAVEELLADKINPTDAEISKDFDDNKATIYKGKSLDDVRPEIVDQLKQTKLRDAFLAWFGEVKKSVTVKNFGL